MIVVVHVVFSASKKPGEDGHQTQKRPRPDTGGAWGGY
jgi:hypothetical protein